MKVGKIVGSRGKGMGKKGTEVRKKSFKFTVFFYENLKKGLFFREGKGTD